MRGWFLNRVFLNSYRNASQQVYILLKFNICLFYRIIAHINYLYWYYPDLNILLIHLFIFSEKVRKCIKALEAAETDTEKFAALFLVPKLVRGTDCDKNARMCIMKVCSICAFSKTKYVLL